MLVMLAAVGLHAQQTNVCTVQGMVKGPDGKAIPGVLLRLTGEHQLGVRTVVTDASGHYHLPLVLPGSYRLIATRTGYLGSEAGLTLMANGITLQDFTLKEVPKDIQGATVAVVAQLQSVDKTESSTSSTLDADTLALLPVGRSDASFFNDVMSLTPGVVAGANGLANFSIRGAIGGESSIRLNDIEIRGGDGTNTLASQSILFDSIQDFQVLQSPLNPKYGNTSGGVVNIVTKTGSNQFSGSLTYPSLTKDSWVSYNGHSANRFGQAYSWSQMVNGYDEANQTMQFFLSGPIVKDKLTFAYGYKGEPTTYTNQQLGSAFSRSTDPTQWWTYLPGVPGTATTLTPGASASLMGYAWGGNYQNPTASAGYANMNSSTWNQFKLFCQINMDQQLELNYTPSQVKGTVSNGGMDMDSVSNQVESKVVSNLIYRAILAPNMVMELKAGKATDHMSINYGSTSDPVSVTAWGYGSQNATFFQPNPPSYSSQYTNTFMSGGLGEYGPSRNDQVSLNADFQLSLGKHELEFGLDSLEQTLQNLEASGPNQRQFYLPGRYYDGSYITYAYEGSLASYADPSNQVLYQNALQMRQTKGFIPEMDVWSSTGGDTPIRNITRSLYGNDQWTVNNHWNFLLGGRIDEAMAKDRTGTRVDVTTFSPRLQATWDPQGDNKRVFSLSYGDFRGYLGNNTMTNFERARGNVIKRYFWNSGPTDPYTYSSTGQISGINPAALVSAAQATNPANYTYLYSAENTDLSYQIPDKHLKPEVARQWELAYRRELPKGGSVRASLVYRKTTDLAMVKNVDTPVNLTTTNDPSSAAATNVTYLRQLVDDPDAYLDYRSFEMEWTCPLFEGRNWKVDWKGNWTLAREVGRKSYVNAQGSYYAQFQDVLSGMGVTTKDTNPVGEMNVPHNILNSGFFWSYGSTKGVRTSATLYVNYTQAPPDSNNFMQYYYYPSGTLSAAANAQAGYFGVYPMGVGRRNLQDSCPVQLTWNMEIPISGKLSFFVNATIRDLFNSPELPAYNQNIMLMSNVQPWTGAKNQVTQPNFQNIDLSGWGNNTTTSTRSIVLASGIHF